MWAVRRFLSLLNENARTFKRFAAHEQDSVTMRVVLFSYHSLSLQLTCMGA